MNPFSLNEKHILITGASSGIGRQCAVSCSQMGAKVTMVARNAERLQKSFNLLEGEGHHVISCDISHLDSIEDVAKESVEICGKIDGFIHAAGIEKTLPVKMHKPKIFKELLQINSLAAFEFSRQLSLKKYGNLPDISLVFISSVVGIVGNMGHSGYSASKGALIAAAKSMAVELAPKKIRVNTISPGHMRDTIMSIKWESEADENAIQKKIDAHPLGLGEAIDVANAAIYLLSSASKWVTGENIIVDGGYCAR